MGSKNLGWLGLISSLLAVACGPGDLGPGFETGQTEDEFSGCPGLVVGGIGYPVGDKTTYPAGGWQMWQVLAHHWSAYNGRHLAQDVSVAGGVGAINAPVYSMAAGEVLYAKANGSSYRNVVLIRHPLQGGGHVCSFYGHVNTPVVTAGQQVSRGQQIATVMNWAVASPGGSASNTHLHYVMLNQAYCNYAASTGTANFSASGVCGYDKGGPSNVGWSNLASEPATYTAVSDACGAWQFQNGLLSPSKFVEAQKSLSCSGGGNADVTVTNLWWTPSNPSPGDAVTLHATVKNIGSGTTGDVVGVGFLVNGAQQNAWWDIAPPMAPGAQKDFHMQAPWIATAGAHVLSANADDIDRFVESDEGNNGMSKTLTIGGGGIADVTVTDLWWTPSNPTVGDAVKLHARVKNVGSAPTGDIVGVGFQIGGVQQNLWWDTTSPMAAGQEHDFQMQATWIATAGSFAVTAHADDIDRFPEADESNNVAAKTMTVASSPFPCDSSKTNCCHYAPQTAGVAATFPGGICDPNGDGSYQDADWTAGWYCYQQACN